MSSMHNTDLNEPITSQGWVHLMLYWLNSYHMTLLSNSVWIHTPCLGHKTYHFPSPLLRESLAYVCPVIQIPQSLDSMITKFSPTDPLHNYYAISNSSYLHQNLSCIVLFHSSLCNSYYSYFLFMWKHLKLLVFIHFIQTPHISCYFIHQVLGCEALLTSSFAFTALTTIKTL